jgi:hypothetical protein
MRGGTTSNGPDSQNWLAARDCPATSTSGPARCLRPRMILRITQRLRAGWSDIRLTALDTSPRTGSLGLVLRYVCYIAVRRPVKRERRFGLRPIITRVIVPCVNQALTSRFVSGRLAGPRITLFPSASTVSSTRRRLTWKKSRVSLVDPAKPFFGGEEPRLGNNV